MKRRMFASLSLGVVAALFMMGCNVTVDPGTGDGGTGQDGGGDGTGGDGTGDGGSVDGGSGDGGGSDTSNFALFTDPDDSTFSTSDVRDVDGEIVKFDAQARSIIWTDEMSYDVGLWTVQGNFLGPGGFFQVRFGSEGGERRAYFTESATATICNITLSLGNIQIYATSTTVPQN